MSHQDVTDTISRQSARGDQMARRFRVTALAIAAAAATLQAAFGNGDWGSVLAIATGYAVGVMLVILVFLLSQFIWLRLRRRSATDDALAWYRMHFSGLHWSSIATGIAAFLIVTGCFTVFKTTVVGASGFGFDAEFIAWDRAIFGGQDPWVLSHSIAASPTATKIIDFLYHPAFLPMLIGYLVCISFRGRAPLRYTYAVTFLACYVVVGMVLAAALHSAGPVYDGVLFGDGQTFAALIDRLAAQHAEAGPFSAVLAQEYLLTLREANRIGLGGGVSAMPSMHIVLVFLWVFAAWHLNRALGFVVTLYGALIWFGSVHLGWHYFVDGLVGVIVAGLIWYAAGRFFGLYPRVR